MFVLWRCAHAILTIVGVPAAFLIFTLEIEDIRVYGESAVTLRGSAWISAIVGVVAATFPFRSSIKARLIWSATWILASGGAFFLFNTAYQSTTNPEAPAAHGTLSDDARIRSAIQLAPWQRNELNELVLSENYSSDLEVRTSEMFRISIWVANYSRTHSVKIS